MNKDIKRLPYKETNKIPKKNLHLIIFSVTLSLLVVGGFAYFFLIYRSDANILKRYLVTKGYTCNNRTCNKKVGSITYTFDYKNTSLTATDKLYLIEASNNHPYLEVRKTKQTCEYEKDDYNGRDKIDETFVTNNECMKYIEDVNEVIKYRNNILNDYK